MGERAEILGRVVMEGLFDEARREIDDRANGCTGITCSGQKEQPVKKP